MTAKTFRDACDGKVWRALQSGVDGLRIHSQRKDFTIDMDTFGSVKGKMCFGCMATCSIQVLSGVSLVSDGSDYTNNRQNFVFKLDEDYADLIRFEEAIDRARVGQLFDLFDHFNKCDLHEDRFDNLFKLKSYNWREELPKVEALIAVLKEADI